MDRRKAVMIFHADFFRADFTFAAIFFLVLFFIFFVTGCRAGTFFAQYSRNRMIYFKNL